MAIYFAWAPGSCETGFVKIGYTNCSPEERLRHLQTGNPDKLILLGWMDGSQQDEFALHQQFALSRRGNEWFGITTGLRTLLREAVNAGRLATRETQALNAVLAGRSPTNGNEVDDWSPSQPAAPATFICPHTGDGLSNRDSMKCVHSRSWYFGGHGCANAECKHFTLDAAKEYVP